MGWESPKLRRVRKHVHSLNMDESGRCVGADLCLCEQVSLLRLLRVVSGASAVIVCLWGKRCVAAVRCRSGQWILVVIEYRALQQCVWTSVV